MKWMKNSPNFFGLTEEGLDKIESLCRDGNTMWFPRGRMMSAYTWDREEQQPDARNAPSFDDVMDKLKDVAECAIVDSVARILRHMIARDITLIPANIPAAPLASEVIKFGDRLLGIELAYTDGDTAREVKQEYRGILNNIYSWGRNSNGAHMKWTGADRETFSAEFNVPDLSYYTRIRRKGFERGRKRSAIESAYDRSKCPKCATIYEFCEDEDCDSVSPRHGDSSSSHSSHHSGDSWWSSGSQSSGWNGWYDKRPSNHWSWGDEHSQ